MGVRGEGEEHEVKNALIYRILDSVSVDERGCFNWKRSLNDGGYGMVKVNRKNRIASRVSYETFRGDIPAGLCVCHKCDNPRCVNPAHLFLGTHKQNTEDAVAKGRMSHGERHHCSKLTKAEVLRIFDLYNSGVDQQEIATMFGVTHISICKLLGGRTWKRVGAIRTRTGPNLAGEKNPRAIVNEDDVREMRRRYDAGETIATLGREYGLSHGGATRICRRMTWKSVT